jgi:hypothetical protein
MSFLNALRVHFAGGFEAAPSTVNNDVKHFNNATFEKIFQTPGPGTTNGWWNPEGDHHFTFDCGVTTAHYGDGTAATGSDPVLTLRVSDRGRLPRRNPAKIVDLDPQQQGVSMIFGLDVVIGAPGAPPLLTAAFAAAPFTDIWRRGTTGGGDERAGAMYQSVLEAPVWGDVSGSRFLQELKAAATGGVLSIKFNLDGYSMARGTPGFTKGRLVGTVGPAAPSEPRHFVRGRHFSNVELLSVPGFPRPRQGVNYCAGLLDEAGRKVWLDLGNALTTNPSGGPVRNVGALSLVCVAPGTGQVPLGDIDYTAANWYEQSAGVVALPPGRTLTDAELAAVRDNPLALVVTPPGASPVVAASEQRDGTHLRADLFVSRLNPGETFAAQFYASRFGRPLAGATVGLVLEPPVVTGPGEPQIGSPPDKLSFPSLTTTDGDGKAAIALTAGNPGNPRGYIDGQVYLVDYSLNGTPVPNGSDSLSVLVFDDFTPDEPPTWFGSMKPIFEQYANLYPVMAAYLDLGNYDDVSANRPMLIAVLNLLQTDAHYMPVTRDLSEAKRAAMVRWLTNVGADGKPLLGVAPPAPPTPLAAPTERAVTVVPEGMDKPLGSKELAAARRRPPTAKKQP